MSPTRGRLSGAGGQQRTQAPRSQQEPGGAAQHGRQQALGEELADQPAATRTQRRSHGDLLLASLGSRQQQVADVGAGNQQHEAHGSQQKE